VPDLAIQVQIVKELSNTALVVLNGSIDAKTVITFQTHLNTVKERGMNRFILDMEKIKYVNSTGLGYLINLSDSLGTDEGGITLVKVQPKVKIVFDMLGLNAFFKIYPTREDALSALTRVNKGSESIPSKKSSTRTTQQAPSKPAPRKSAPARKAPSGALRILCATCKSQIAVREPGTFKCPRCLSLFNYSGNGKASFLPRRSAPPVQMSLHFGMECTDGLVGFVKGLSLARELGLGDDETNELESAVRETVSILHDHAYGGNRNNIYHVQIITSENSIELRFADYGASLSVDRKGADGQSIFTRLRGQVDRFELKNHPKGGNFIIISKGIKKEIGA
jgi:anti-anti-sigma factor